MDLEEMQAFLNVVETGSFHAAADALGMPRTTLKRRVDSLEARAGVSLLQRTRQGIVLTDAGQVLAGRGRAMIEEASALLASIRELGQEPSGVLRVAMPVGMPPHLVTPLYAALRSAYPRLRVHGRFSNDPLSESLVDIDMAVHFGERTPGGPWISHVIMRIREWLVASQGYLSRRGTPRSIDDLGGHELFAWQAPGEDAHVWPMRTGGTFTVEPALIATDIHLIRQCCIAGLGIGLIPDARLADPNLSGNTLVSVLPELVGRERALRVTVPAALAEIPKIKMVLAHVRRFLGNTSAT